MDNLLEENEGHDYDKLNFMRNKSLDYLVFGASLKACL